jgi:hypothetical protein
MAEPRDPFIKDAQVVDEQSLAAGKKAAAAAAANMPKVNPKTGATSDLFQGKYGVFEAILNDPIYGEELRYIKYVREVLKDEALANDLWQKSKWGQLDSDAQLRYVQKLEQSKVYEERLKNWLIKIKATLSSKGISIDDATLKKYYDDGIDDTTIIDELTPKITATDATGAAGQYLQTLRQTAESNGFDLDVDFSGQVDSWLQQISKGKNINDFVQIIRNKAAEGKPKFVQDKLKAGNDLRAIYATYIGAMATAFGVDAATISLDDDLLNQAFTDKGATKINDFQNLIRKDTRFKGTSKAASEEDFRIQVADRALSIGATVTDKDIDAIVSELLATGVSPSTNAIDAKLRKFITYSTAGRVAGAAGNNLQILKDTAARNGLDLDKAFGGSVQDWLQKVDQGESIETYKRIIRDAAKMGLPDNVKKMLDQGVDLTTIFAPYRNYMGRILEINPDTIDINDPVLRSAIGPDKEMTLYDFQRSLRKDSRWQYTDNAREDVSNSALTVLRNFGFQG